MKESSSAPTPAPIVDLTFPHNWQAEILAARPLILPKRHFVYPLNAEEVERGALEVLIRTVLIRPVGRDSVGRDSVGRDSVGRDFSPDISPANKDGALQAAEENPRAVGQGFIPGSRSAESTRALAPEACFSGNSPDALIFSAASLAPEVYSQPFLATCALGFRDAIVPTGLWSCPNADEICAVSGGYAYIIDTAAPERFTMIPYRPVLEVRALAAQGLLLFVGHHSMLAWGATGHAWQSEKLSDEGITITAIEGTRLHGLGWNMIADKETLFVLDFNTGMRM
jgi:hypothetical protein